VVVTDFSPGRGLSHAIGQTGDGVATKVDDELADGARIAGLRRPQGLTDAPALGSFATVTHC
jgi:hypothetical protein